MDFESLGLKIGDLLQLELVGERGRYPVRLIGIAPQLGFIISPPRKNGGHYLFLKENQPVIVRFAVLNTVIAFNSQVLEDKMKPYPHVHLVIPPEVESIEVRRAVRIRTNLRATIINETQESKSMTVRMADLSPMGARLETPVVLGDKGDQLSLTLHLEVAGHTFTVTVNSIIAATGINYVRDKKSGEDKSQGFFFGIQFSKLDLEDVAPLHAFVYGELLKEFHAL